ncbi:MAG TPA: putative porin [Vicinamibacterales bacterium]|nr:putative porin [Vicinamibacterales bacterium]
MSSVTRVAAAVLACALAATPLVGRAESDRQSLEELRNTVINLLQTLVEQHVMTAEQAAKLVHQAQEKAVTDAQAAAKRDEGAVRVPYVPQIVKDDIGRQVAAELEPKVVNDVVATAKTERWGVPGALPDWLSTVRVTGDVRVRFEEDLYGRDNLPFSVPDYGAINQAGGITQAGLGAFLNTTQDVQRPRLRARLGLVATLSDSFQAGIRLATGGALDPSSESQTFGTTAARYNIGLDQGYIRFEPRSRPDFSYVTAIGGRMPSPWFTPTELIFARDVSFEGFATTARAPLGGGSNSPTSSLFATVGAFPIQLVPQFHGDNKWMLASQLGADLWAGSDDRLRLAAAYYDFIHVTGIQNQPGQTYYNFTAPPFVRYGNTYFDIANSLTGSSNLFALAAKFRVANLSFVYDHRVGRYTFSLTADAARNIGYDAHDVAVRSGIVQDARTRGYVGEIAFGDPDPASALGRWRAAVGYRYVQRDAVLDAWTDADFHGGGTNARGYFLVGDLGLSRGVWLRLRYMNADAIDSPPPFALDIIQIDLNSRF